MSLYNRKIISDDYSSISTLPFLFGERLPSRFLEAQDHGYCGKR
jgi:hypothetical protein